MGISIYMSDLILQDHLYRTLPDTVVTVGRTFMGYSYEDLMCICRRNGFTPHETEVEYDDYTNEAKRMIAETGIKPVSDRTFFKTLGIKTVKTMDISDYEGADIILNLNRPIPDELENTIDLIVGGSTLDNVFDPAQYIKNMARLLKPGGRLIEINIASDHGRPYVILPAAWYFDYFVVNGFDDCKVYVLEHSSAVHYYYLDVNYNPNQSVGCGLIDNFENRSEAAIGTVFIAEKGSSSTWDAVPTQDAWRNEKEIEEYNQNLKRILDSSRPLLKLMRSETLPVRHGENSPCPNYRYIGHFNYDLAQCDPI
jgi:SAM-dependent methyltransferase